MDETTQGARIAVIAGDVGATHARLALAPLGGGVVAEATGPGGNQRSSGPAALDHLQETVRAVLDEGRRQLGEDLRIAGVALGISGAGPALAAEVRRAVGERLADLGIPAERLLVTDDLHTAFLSGGVGDDGLLVLAGTGAVAVRFRDRAAIARRDGMGWLLGDIGSAVWLGRRTLQAVAADLDGRGRRTLLTERVGDLLDLDLRDGLLPPSPTGDPRQDLIRALDELLPAGAPAALGRFAAVPGSVPEDPAAREILDTAARHVRDTVRALDPEGELPVVLAGSVLATPGPIREEVLTGLRAEGRSVATVADAVPGALRLARELAAGAAAGAASGADG
ncbi:BadF/BadG/BcrA/BcrD ATPase family protein [Brachybacterium sp. J144]|uniref:N-acetylglucosamine kinase n=1 Tax=Brachybacterium sp. J144 TaxID=3116487 RepID=UPI002E78A19B|nr:BadF/BadG/BcrA/BcrD ATPase family protein [Brachybacterium sp. J144]MEE1650937.1 BadF/BadG/BcrA/BcrD ATPase family protein [Brachybacterium sp. J144]